MRILKKRVHIISLFLILSFLFLPAASILMIHHITVSETIVGMDAGFLGTSSSAFAIRKESITMREVAAVAAACGKNIAVYQDYKGPEQVRAIYFSGTYANLPMMEGRFFQESDFTAGNRCAVVGKNRRSELVQRGGKAYIELQGVPFEVLGVMGPEEETAFDSTVLINGLAEPELFRDILYRLDFFRIDGEQRADAFAATVEIAPVVEEGMKLLPLLFYLLVFEPQARQIGIAAVITALSFATFENICYLIQNGAGHFSFIFFRGIGTGAMHVICGAIVGGGLAYVWQRTWLKIAGTCGLLGAAITFHAIYNLLIAYGGAIQYIAYILPVLILAVGKLIVRLPQSHN